MGAITERHGVGIGQTWKNKTGDRAINTTYTNTTGRPIEIAVNLIPSEVSQVLIYVDETLAGFSASAYTAARGQGASAIVPNGSTYRATTNLGTPTLDKWQELTA